MRMICIDDGPFRRTEKPSGLVKWKEYDVYPCTEESHGGVECGGLDIPSVPIYACWHPDRFRPIREVDVAAIFKCEELIGEGV